MFLFPPPLTFASDERTQSWGGTSIDTASVLQLPVAGVALVCLSRQGVAMHHRDEDYRREPTPRRYPLLLRLIRLSAAVPDIANNSITGLMEIR